VLVALNVATGQERAKIQIGQTSRFATPTISGTTLFVGTLTGVVAVSLT
jgi:hypothetical protein